MPAVAAVLLFVVGEVVRPGFASLDSVEAVLVVASFVGLVAAGQTFVILIGGIDLSVPWILNARGDPAGDQLAGRRTAARRWRCRLTLGMGALVGCVNGMGVACWACRRSS